MQICRVFVAVVVVAYAPYRLMVAIETVKMWVKPCKISKSQA